jgi:hypothetical protein
MGAVKDQNWAVEPYGEKYIFISKIGKAQKYLCFKYGMTEVTSLQFMSEIPHIYYGTENGTYEVTKILTVDWSLCDSFVSRKRSL